MKILYQINSLETVYAARFIYEGYKDAFTDIGHEFKPFTSNHNLEQVLNEFNPDIFITSLNSYNLKFIDLDILKKHRKKGLVVFTQIRPWKKQNTQFGGSNLEEETKLVNLIKNDLAGDIFFHWLEQDDPSMDGFSKNTGKPFYTILLAANKLKYFDEYDEKYESEISYIGSYLPSKRAFMKKHLLPLQKNYDLRLYGSDWTLQNLALGYIQKVGQYLNINPLKRVRSLGLEIDDERKVYSSSLISLNIHEDHQREFGSDFNERTFKIPACGGFEISDNVKAIRKYFTEDELVIAKNTSDWFEKIEYFTKNPEKRIPIIKLGQKKVLEEHTYHNRVTQVVNIFNNFKHRKQ